MAQAKRTAPGSVPAPLDHAQRHLREAAASTRLRQAHPREEVARQPAAPQEARRPIPPEIPAEVRRAFTLDRRTAGEAG
jgi:hypothetical protein